MTRAGDGDRAQAIDRDGARAPLAEHAPAKVNLTLHVTGRREDGYHLLESLVAFADAGDELTLEPGGPLSLTVEGETAVEAGPEADNLVLGAARALLALRPGLTLGRFRLRKDLPVAAGLGGGSSDAAAALRLLARANGLAPDDSALRAAALATGADVPVCLDPRARLMRGIGDLLSGPLGLAPLPVLLVNPRVACRTAPVFAALGLSRGASLPGAPHPALRPQEVRLLAALQAARNDLEPPARALVPAISASLDLVAGQPGCHLARMSGSGASVFGLFADMDAAVLGQARVAAAHPGWWARATWLR